MLAFLILVVPINWLVASVLAAMFHEICHAIAIWFCTGTWQTVRLYSSGARIELPQMSRGREVLCALAGPFGGLCLLLLGRWMPRIAICGALQSIFNLFPIYPFDGGRAIQSGLLLVFSPPQVEMVCTVLRWIFVSMICLLAVYGCIGLKLGIFPLLLAALLLIRTK